MTLCNRILARGALLVLAACTSPAAYAAPEEKDATLAQRLHASYRAVKTISCEIRKAVTAEGKTVRWLSRVHYRAPNRIHVENVAPLKRRIIADGTNVYYHVKGYAKGFSAPLSKLDEPMLSASRNIPATPVEHLVKLLDKPETVLPATDDFPLRRGYRVGSAMVVLSCDAHGRLAQVDFFKTPKAEALVAQYVYSSFAETTGGAWIPRRHKAKLILPDREKITETRRIDNLVVDEPLAEALFDASLFFKGIEFVDDFREAMR